MKEVILGTGIAGLILGIKRPKAILVGKDKGQIQGKYSLGPRVIQYSKDTEKFLKDFGFDTRVETVHIGYQVGDYVYRHLDQFEMPVDFRKEYSLFTRGKPDYEKSFLSAGQNSIDCLCLDHRDRSESFGYLGETLYNIQQRRIIEGTVESINPTARLITLEGGGEIHYDHLTSTLSQKIFQNLLPERFIPEEDLELSKKNFLVVEPEEKMDSSQTEFFYVYGIDTFSRRTFFNDYDVLEFSDHPKSKAVFDQAVKGETIKIGKERLKVLEKLSIPVQIKDSKKILRHPWYNDIEFQGRFAEWNHGVLINDLMEA